MAELAVRLKTELKRTLRKYVGDAVNDVCDAFVEELKPPPVTASRNEGNYDCCRRLVEYMEKNMDTSPCFAAQMDCVILAYQSNASVEVLNAVVTQNLWVRRKGRVAGGEEMTDKVNGVDQINTNDVMTEMPLSAATKLTSDSVDAMRSVSTKTLKIKANKRINAKSTQVPSSKQIKTKRTRGTSSASRTRFAGEEDDTSANVLVNFVGDVANVVKLGNTGLRNAPMKAKTSLPETMMIKAGSTGSSNVSNVVNASSQIAQLPADILQPNEPLNTTSPNNIHQNAGGVETSRPRKWGKRKRLVTSKRQNATASDAKRSRRAPKHSEPLDISSTETEDSEHEKGGADKETEFGEYDHEKMRIGFKETSEAVKSTTVKTLKPNGAATTANEDHKTVTTKSLTVKAVGRAEKKVTKSKTESSITKAGRNAKAVKQIIPTPKISKSAAGDEKESKIGKVEGANVDMKKYRTTHELLIDAELCQMERDLAAGDENGELEAAKTSFQEMLNAVVSVQAPEINLKELIKPRSQESDAITPDPICSLCSAAQRSPEQTHVFKMRLRDTILIVDALLCKPPRGFMCSRDCKTIRAQMCNEFTPCINPTCRAWHEAEAHSELCTDEQCELKPHVMLRETMHLIQHKQQEVTETCDALELANAALLSRTRQSSKERSTTESFNAKRVETLQNELQVTNDELATLNDTRMENLTKLKSIGFVSHSDKVDGFPDFDSHYIPKSYQRKKS